MLEIDVIKLLDLCSYGIIIFDKQGEISHVNKRFNQLPFPVREQFELHKTNIQALEGYQWQWITLEAGQAMVITCPENISESDELLSNMLRTINNTEYDIFTATVKAVYEVLGWRWISVTRLHDNRAEVLAHWDTDHIADSFAFDLVGTPCEVMARNERYTLFTDVQMAFPENTALQQIGAKSYAGIIYRNGQQQAVGHIMAIHDQRDVDYRRTEDVLTLASLALSANIELANLNSQLTSALSAARTDPLTGLANRAVFDEISQQAVERYTSKQQDCYLAIIDLNSFKAFNDQRGHIEGDRLLRLMATELTKVGRNSDHAMRLGGDEFALIFVEANDRMLSRIQRQICESMHRLSLIFDQPIGASIGFAQLGEVEGDLDAWYALADQRMYSEKAKRK